MGCEPGWTPPLRELWGVLRDVSGCSGVLGENGGGSRVSGETGRLRPSEGVLRRGGGSQGGLWGESVVSVLLGTLQGSCNESWGVR